MFKLTLLSALTLIAFSFGSCVEYSKTTQNRSYVETGLVWVKLNPQKICGSPVYKTIELANKFLLEHGIATFERKEYRWYSISGGKCNRSYLAKIYHKNVPAIEELGWTVVN